MKKRGNTLIIGIITSFITTFMGSGLNLAIPALEEEFGVSTSSIGWVVTVYMITCAALAVPFGYLADKLKKRNILLTGLFVFSLTSCLSVISGEMWVLLVFRVLQAVGAVMIFCTNVAMMAEDGSPEDRGKIVGYAAGANYAGLAAGPVLGGMLNYNFGWRSIFVVTAAISAAAFVLGLIKLPKGPEKPNQQHKIAGLIKNKVFIRSNIAAMINYGANYTVGYILSIYLQSVRGMSSQNAGFILLTNTVVMAIMAPLSGRLSDKFNPQTLSAAGMGICACVNAVFTFFAEDTSLAMLTVVLAVSGFGAALFAAPNTNTVMGCVQKEEYGTASSIISSMRSLGNTLSMGVVTASTGFFMGSGNLKTAETTVVMDTMHTVFTVFTILCILGIFMAKCRKV